jgi:hypothetical protein
VGIYSGTKQQGGFMAGKVNRNRAGKDREKIPRQARDDKYCVLRQAQDDNGRYGLNRRNGRWVLMVVLLIAVALPAMIYINPQSAKIISIKPASASGYDLALNPLFSAPKNVQIKGIANTGGAYDSLVITWDKVPGAKGYRIYSSAFMPDTTIWVNHCDKVEGTDLLVYMYSFHPRFGDMYFERTTDDPIDSPGVKMWRKQIVDAHSLYHL